MQGSEVEPGELECQGLATQRVLGWSEIHETQSEKKKGRKGQRREDRRERKRESPSFLERVVEAEGDSLPFVEGCGALLRHHLQHTV